jgi:hypothetical protein
MRSPRQSRTTTGSLTHSTFNPTEDHLTSDVPLPTQDGGNSSSTKDQQLSMRKERSLKLLVNLMVKTRTLVSIHKAMKSINNGISCMLMNGRENQSKEN